MEQIKQDIVDVKNTEATILNLMSDFHKMFGTLNANVSALTESNKNMAESHKNMANVLERMNANIATNKESIKDIKTNQEIEKKKLLEHESRLAALEMTYSLDKPIIENIRGLKSRGIKLASYVGAVFLALGIATDEGQKFLVAVWKKIFVVFLK